MWSTAGPSWLLEERTGSSYQWGVERRSDASPPTKWPRATTPTRRDSLLGTSTDSGIGLGLSFNSPPIINRINMNFASPILKTPTSRPNIHLSTTPSPFRSFRLSSFSSPSYSSRALRLSNTENVIGVRFCEETMSKTHGVVDMTKMASGSSNVSRCLQMPSTSGVESPDRTLPMRMEAPETPSKCLALDDSGLFTDGFPILSTSTPLKRSHIEFASPVYHMEDQIVDSESSGTLGAYYRPAVSPGRQSPPTPSSFKRAMQEVQRQGTLQPKQLLKNSNDGNLAFKFSTSEFVSTEASSHPDVPPRKRKRELEADEVFRSPKKPLKPYSRRWIRIVTGSTRVQRDMTLAAKTFLSQRAVLSSIPPPTSSLF